MEPGSTLYTDEWVGYLGLLAFLHLTVCHSRKEYARDADGDGVNEVHCNTMEGIWSLLRHWLRNFRGVRKTRLYLYVHAFEVVYNLRRRALDPLASLLFILLSPHRCSA